MPRSRSRIFAVKPFVLHAMARSELTPGSLCARGRCNPPRLVMTSHVTAASFSLAGGPRSPLSLSLSLSLCFCSSARAQGVRGPCRRARAAFNC